MQLSPEPSFIGRFKALLSAPRELWIVYFNYILENIAYGMASSTFILWLSADLGFSDTKAGWMIATWSTTLTLVTVLVGSLTDSLGLRKTFLLGFTACLTSRAVMTFSTAKWIVLPFGLFLLAIGVALMTPVMTAAVKRYSNAAQRSIAFSLYYALMNVGFAIAGWLFDWVRTTLGERGTYIVPGLDVSLSSYRVLFGLGVLFTIPGLIIAWTSIREGVEMTEQGVCVEGPKPPKYPGKGPLRAIALTCRDTLASTLRIFSNLWGQPSFYRFLVFMALVVGVRLIFYHMHYTFPKYGIRELGEGAPIGRLFSVLNPVLIVLLVPICGALTTKVSAYRMVSWGSLVSSLSVFFIALPPAWFKPMADGWFGHLIAHQWLGVTGEVNPLYVSITLFIVLLSIGEAFWSPRLYEYAAAIAPKGQEASYMALSLLPYFGAKFVVGGISGTLLQTYCPETGPRSSETMWLLIGLMALITPIGTFVFRKYIQVQESGRELEVSKAEAAAREEEVLEEEK